MVLNENDSDALKDFKIHVDCSSSKSEINEWLQNSELLKKNSLENLNCSENLMVLKWFEKIKISLVQDECSQIKMDRLYKIYDT